MIPFGGKKQKKKTSATMTIFVDGNRTVRPVKLKLQEESFEYIKKGNLKKDLLNLINTA